MRNRSFPDQGVCARTAASRGGAACRKLQSTSGETISEVLVGVLIVALATALFATMVSVSSRISLMGVDRTQDTYQRLSNVDKASVDAGASTAVQAGTAQVVVGRAETNERIAEFSVVSLTSSGDGASSAFSFSRYMLPGIEDGSKDEGGA